MLFLVHMQVELPPSMPAPERDELVARERAFAQERQRAGTWRHLWRVAGQYANYSVFDVGSPDELHELLSALPLFPYMRLDVTALAHHPSALEGQPPGEGGIRR